MTFASLFFSSCGGLVMLLSEPPDLLHFTLTSVIAYSGFEIKLFLKHFPFGGSGGPERTNIYGTDE